MRDCLYWGGFLVCLYVYVGAVLIDVERPSPVWVATFPRQGIKQAGKHMGFHIPLGCDATSFLNFLP